MLLDLQPKILSVIHLRNIHHLIQTKDNMVFYMEHNSGIFKANSRCQKVIPFTIVKKFLTFATSMITLRIKLRISFRTRTFKFTALVKYKNAVVLYEEDFKINDAYRGNTCIKTDALTIWL